MRAVVLYPGGRALGRIDGGTAMRERRVPLRVGLEQDRGAERTRVARQRQRARHAPTLIEGVAPIVPVAGIAAREAHHTDRRPPKRGGARGATLMRVPEPHVVDTKERGWQRTQRITRVDRDGVGRESRKSEVGSRKLIIGRRRRMTDAMQRHGDHHRQGRHGPPAPHQSPPTHRPITSLRQLLTSDFRLPTSDSRLIRPARPQQRERRAQ